MGDQTAPPSTLVPEPGSGRVFRSHRPIRLSDAAPDGRLRLDAMARYMQDVASDDVADAHAEDARLTWVVRRTVIQVSSPFKADTTVALATWASGSGSHWAARRTTIGGNEGGRAEAESIWVLIDRAAGRLTRLPAAFDALYGPSTLGRIVSAKLELPARPVPEASTLPWPLRLTDLDALGHANNAVYWEAIETALALVDRSAAGPLRAVLEYRRAVDLASDLTLAVAGIDATTSVWFIDSGETAACAVIQAA
ncbi:MAG: acyl-ACP thioesterase domain-containing protein [Candidatus Dormiibacterota bacterium]